MLGRSPSNGSLGSKGSSFSRVSDEVRRAVGRANSLTTSLGRSGKTGLFGAISPSLHGQRDANREQDIKAEESGQWWYLVASMGGVSARQDASYCNATKTSSIENHYKEGTLVAIDRRRTAGWTKWLHIKNSEGWLHGDQWLFDVSPKNRQVRVVEVEVSAGSWQYECIAKHVIVNPAQLLLRPIGTFDDQLRQTEVVQIVEKVRPVLGKGTFLKLADDRGWVLDFVDGQQVMQQQAATVDGRIDWYSESMGRTSDSPQRTVSSGSVSSGGYVQNVSCPQNVGTSAACGYQTCANNMSDSLKPEGHAPMPRNLALAVYQTLSNQAALPCLPSNAFGMPAVPSSADPLPGVGGHLSESEYGRWEYMVVDSKGFSLRGSPNYDQGQKISKRIEEGQVVVVVERIEGEGTTFLHLESPEGWCFDRQPAGRVASRMRLLEVHVERGLWHYLVVADQGIGLRARCSFSELAKIGKGPLKGALVEVNERVAIGETTFLRLKDSSGWIFDKRNGKSVVQGPIEVKELPAYTMATVQAPVPAFGPARISLASSPTRQHWAVATSVLLNGAKVQATHLCEAEGDSWTFVKTTENSLEGWAPADVITLEGSAVHDTLRAIDISWPKPRHLLTVQDRPSPRMPETQCGEDVMDECNDARNGVLKCFACDEKIPRSRNASIVTKCPCCGHTWNEDRKPKKSVPSSPAPPSRKVGWGAP